MQSNEQEQYMKMLKQIISQTKNNQIKTTDQLIHALIGELTKTNMYVDQKINMTP